MNYFLRFQTAQQFDLPLIAIQLVGGFQTEGQRLQGAVADDARQCLDADGAVPKTGVAILAAAGGILAVVEVDMPYLAH